MRRLFAAGYVEDRVNGAVRLNEERTSAQQDRILEATDRVEQLRSQLSEPGAPRSSIRADIDAQNRLIAAAQTTLLSLPTASPDAAVLSRSADLPTGASNKTYLSVGGLAALLGLALGIGLALVRVRLVEPITDRESLEEVLNAPVLAAVPDLTRRRDMRETSLVVVGAPDSPGAQAYLAAGVALSHLTRDDSTRVIAIGGPGQGEGKTSTTANLAAVLAHSGRRVVALSSDLRNPRLHLLFDRSNDVGLTSLLTGRAQLGDVLQTTQVTDLFLISSGPVPENPAELLGGDAMAHLLDELSTGLDFVLLDTSPGLVVADVLFLAPRVDGFIVVSDVRTSRADVARLRSQLEGAGGRIIGGVLSRVESKHVDRYLYDSAFSEVWGRARRRFENGISRPSQQERVRTEAAADGSPLADAAGEGTSGVSVAREKGPGDGKVSTDSSPPSKRKTQATREEGPGDGKVSTDSSPPSKRKTQATREEGPGDGKVSTDSSPPSKRKTQATREEGPGDGKVSTDSSPPSKRKTQATREEGPGDGKVSTDSSPPSKRKTQATREEGPGDGKVSTDSSPPSKRKTQATPEEGPGDGKVSTDSSPPSKRKTQATREEGPGDGKVSTVSSSPSKPITQSAPEERPTAEEAPEERPTAEEAPEERPTAEPAA